MPNQPKGNLRYRLTPEVAAELNFLRVIGRYDSWDDFFSAMTRKWKAGANELAPTKVKAEFEAVRAQLRQLEALYGVLLRNMDVQSAILAGMMDAVQGIHAAQEESQGLLQQFTSLLSIAFGPEEMKPDVPLAAMSKLERRIRMRTP